MKRPSILLLVVITYSVGGCGLLDMPDKMDETNRKMDATNQKMDRMVSNTDLVPKKMDSTNDLMKTTNTKMDETASKIDSTNRKMDDTNSKIDSTNQKMDEMKSTINRSNEKMDLTIAGIESSNKKMDITIGEIASSNQKMDVTIAEIDSSNKKMDITIQEISSTNKKMDTMIEQVTATNKKIALTNKGIHLQTLNVALDEMLKPRNTKYLFPVPISMLAAGETFANEASAEEIAKLVHVYLQEIDEQQPESTFPDWDSLPETAKQEHIRQMNEDKQIKLYSLLIIAGLTPQTTVEELVQSEITTASQYYDVALAFLMLRAEFIGDIAIGADLFAKDMKNLGAIEEGIRQVEYLDYLTQLPFASQIGLQTHGFLPPAQNHSEKLDLFMTPKLWRRLDHALNYELDLSRIPDSERSRIERAQTKIKSARSTRNTEGPIHKS